MFLYVELKLLFEGVGVDWCVVDGECLCFVGADLDWIEQTEFQLSLQIAAKSSQTYCLHILLYAWSGAGYSLRLRTG
jgi:hypothetical protein